MECLVARECALRAEGGTGIMSLQTLSVRRKGGKAVDTPTMRDQYGK